MRKEDGQQMVMRSCRDPIREPQLERNDATLRCLFNSSTYFLFILFLPLYLSREFFIIFQLLFTYFLSSYLLRSSLSGLLSRFLVVAPQKLRRESYFWQHYEFARRSVRRDCSARYGENKSGQTYY